MIKKSDTEQTGESGSQSTGFDPALARSEKRFIALRWTLAATYHESWSQAEDALAVLPASQRAGIVDSLTGQTLASQVSYSAVEEAVSGEVLGIMRREGILGDLANERRRRRLT